MDNLQDSQYNTIILPSGFPEFMSNSHKEHFLGQITNYIAQNISQNKMILFLKRQHFFTIERAKIAPYADTLALIAILY